MNLSDWSREFSITSITREDLVSAGFGKRVVRKLNDDEMREIATMMEEIYCDTGYWEDLEQCVKRLLKQKQQDEAVFNSEN